MTRKPRRIHRPGYPSLEPEDEDHGHTEQVAAPQPDSFPAEKAVQAEARANQGKLSVLEAVVYGMCHEGTTREQANQALSRFKDGFFNWNEVRSQHDRGDPERAGGTSRAEPRAQRIRRFLRQLFEKTYGFTLEALTKKPLKDSLKALSEYEAFASDYIQATVIQQAPWGHAIPVDEPSRRALIRLGIVESDAEPAAFGHCSNVRSRKTAARSSLTCSRNSPTTLCCA